MLLPSCVTKLKTAACACQNSLNLISTIHPIQYTVALGTSTYCQLKVLFFTFAKERPITVHVDHEVSSSTRLSFYKNLLIGQERECPLSGLTGVRIKRVQFGENVRAFLPQGQSKMSVITKCPY